MAFLDISLETANKFYSWGGRASIAGAVITAVAIVFLVWGTRVRDRDALVQISEANLSAAQANERAAELEVQAATLRTELARRTQPLVARTITNGQAEKLTNALMGNAVGITVISLSGDAETTTYAAQLRAALTGAGASVSTRTIVGAIALPDGLILVGPRSEALTNVESALVKAGITFRYMPDDPIPSIAAGSLKIIVGQREQLSN